MKTNQPTIIYQDLSGVITTRKISNCQLGWKKDRLECFCESAKAERSFLLDSILQFKSKKFNDDLTKFVQSLPFEEPPDYEINDEGEVSFTFTPEIRFGEKGRVRFTGFSKKTKGELEKLAEDSGFYVIKTGNPFVHYLVTGSRAGQKKIDKALMLGSFVIEEHAFRLLLSN